MRGREAQIALLTIIVFFVGGMVGLERTVVPLMGVRLFGLASASAAFSFVVSFGLTKAVMNLFVGRLADLWGRRHLLLAGFAIGIPIPLLLMNASNWNGIIIANFLLGIMQSLTWSMTVLMGVDHAGSRARGLVVGLNEFAGYAGLSLVAFITGVIAEWTHLRPQPFYLGIGLVIIGISLSFFAEETRILAHTETKIRQEDVSASFGTVILRTTLRHPSLSAASLGGLATNLKDGMMWGLLPLFLHARHLNLIAIGTVVAVYPAVWASGQLLFGPLSDHVGRKALIASGLTLQGLALLVFLWAVSFWEWLIAAVLLGVGTAMVYPTLIALVSDMAAPTWRASALGVYRCWRDLGYAVGAIIAGFISDTIGIPAALLITALLMGVVAIQAGMRIRSPAQRPATLG